MITILLQAILEKLQSGGAAPSNASSAVITLDPAGGTMAGKTEFREAIGKTFVFAEEPVWEGHTFLYWQNAADPNVRYQTGDKFIIQKPETFVAVWE